MQIARATAYACLTALALMLALVAALLILGFIVNMVRDGNISALTKGGVSALLVSIALSFACRWGAKRFITHE
jgi:hypothetical protein